MKSVHHPSYWDWELALTRHYLGTDGPEGASALQFLDAHPRRLAQAIGKPIAEAEAVRKQFLSIFKRRGLIDAFVHGDNTTPPAGWPVMGHLNYLVLSCYVASVSPDVSESGQFPHRLKEVLELDQGISSMKGLAKLWEKAEDWCKRSVASGLDVRELALPDPGNMSRIGYSIRISFPSRHELQKMGRLFGELAAKPSLTAKEVSDAVRVELAADTWSQSFREAFGDFDRRRVRGERLLADHPFWLGLTGLVNPVDQRPDGPSSFVLEASTDFDGVENYAVTTAVAGILSELGITPSHSTSDTIHTIDVSLGQVLDILERRPGDVPGDMLRCYREGYIPFVETGWGVWRGVRHSGEARVRPLVRDDVVPIGRDTAGQRVAWRLLSVISAQEAALLASKVRRQPPVPPTDVRRVRIVDGIRLDRSYLGRSKFLPSIEAVEGCDVSVVAISAVSEDPVARVEGASIALTCSRPIEGVWRFPIREAGTVRSNPSVAFQRNVAERPVRLADEIVPGWRQAEPEILGCDDIEVSPTEAGTVEPNAEGTLLDLLEALYGGGASGWDEKRLHELLARVLPVARAGWDLLRLLVDSGWMEARVCKTWRARKWFLVPPRLVAFAGRNTVLLEGAAPESLRDRFVETAETLGGRAVGRIASRGWSIPQLVAEVDDVHLFARAMNLKLVDATASISRHGARLDFKRSLYTDEFRLVSSNWSWRKSRFVGYGGDVLNGVSIDRLSTLKPNAADIYRIAVEGGPPILIDGRIAALALGHRLAQRPLFRFDPTGEYFDRVAYDGGMPPPFSRYLRLRRLVGPAILFHGDGEWTYRTSCCRTDASRLAATFGAAFEGGSSLDAASISLRAEVMTRARGARAEVVAERIWKGV